MTLHTIIQTVLFVILKLLLIAINGTPIALNLLSSIRVRILELVAKYKHIKNLWNLPLKYIRKLLNDYTVDHKSGNWSSADSCLSSINPKKLNLRDKLRYQISIWTNNAIYYAHKANTPESSESEESEEMEDTELKRIEENEETSEEKETIEMEVKKESTHSSVGATGLCNIKQGENQPEVVEKINETINAFKRKANEPIECLNKRKKSSDSQTETAEIENKTFDYSGNLTEGAEKDSKSRNRSVGSVFSSTHIDTGIQCRLPIWPSSDTHTDIGVQCNLDVPQRSETYTDIDTQRSLSAWQRDCQGVSQLTDLKSITKDRDIVETKGTNTENLSLRDVEGGMESNLSSNKIKMIDDPQTSPQSELKEVSTDASDPYIVYLRDREINLRSDTRVHGSQSPAGSVADPVKADIGSQNLYPKTEEDSKLSSMQQSDTCVTEIDTIDIKILNVVSKAKEINVASGLGVESSGTSSDMKKTEAKQISVLSPSKLENWGLKTQNSPPSMSSKQWDAPDDDSSGEDSLDNSFLGHMVTEEIPERAEKPEETEKPEENPEKLQTRHRLCELHAKNPKLKDLTNRIEWHAEAIKSTDITEMNEIKNLEFWRNKLTLESSDVIESSNEKDAKLVCDNNRDSAESHIIKDIASVSPIKVRDKNYKPFPGIAPDPNTVKKDARYQKKFYRQQKESAILREGENVEDLSKSPQNTSEPPTGEGDCSRDSAESHNIKDISSVSPIKVQDENYKPWPGIASDPNTVKKDAKYQKKFYRQQKESAILREGENVEDPSKSPQNTSEPPTGEGSCNPVSSGSKSPSGEGSCEKITGVFKVPLGKGIYKPASSGIKSPSREGSCKPVSKEFKTPTSKGICKPMPSGLKPPSGEVKSQNTGNEGKLITIQIPLQSFIDSTVHKSFNRPPPEEIKNLLDTHMYRRIFRPFTEQSLPDVASESVASSVSDRPKASTSSIPESPRSIPLSGDTGTDPLLPCTLLQTSDSAEITGSYSRQNSDKNEQTEISEIALVTHSLDPVGPFTYNPPSDKKLEEHSTPLVPVLENQSRKTCDHETEISIEERLWTLRNIKDSYNRSHLSRFDYVMKNVTEPGRCDPESDFDLELIDDLLSSSHGHTRHTVAMSSGLTEQGTSVSKHVSNAAQIALDETRDSRNIPTNTPSDTQALVEASKSASVIRGKESFEIDILKISNPMREKDNTGESLSHLDPNAKTFETQHEKFQSKNQDKCISFETDKKPETKQETDYVPQKLKCKRTYSDHAASSKEISQSPIKMGEGTSTNASRVEEQQKKPKIEHEETPDLDEKIKHDSIGIDKESNNSQGEQSNAFDKSGAFEQPCEDEEISKMPLSSETKVTKESQVYAQDHADEIRPEMDSVERSPERSPEMDSVERSPERSPEMDSVERSPERSPEMDCVKRSHESSPEMGCMESSTDMGCVESSPESSPELDCVERSPELDCVARSPEMDCEESELSKSKNVSEPFNLSEGCPTERKLELKDEKSELDEQNKTGKSASINLVKDSENLNSENVSCENLPSFTPGIKENVDIIKEAIEQTDSTETDLIDSKTALELKDSTNEDLEQKRIFMRSLNLTKAFGKSNASGVNETDTSNENLLSSLGAGHINTTAKHERRLGPWRLVPHPREYPRPLSGSKKIYLKPGQRRSTSPDSEGYAADNESFADEDFESDNSKHDLFETGSSEASFHSPDTSPSDNDRSNKTTANSSNRKRSLGALPECEAESSNEVERISAGNENDNKDSKSGMERQTVSNQKQTLLKERQVDQAKNYESLSTLHDTKICDAQKADENSKANVSESYTDSATGVSPLETHSESLAEVKSNGGKSCELTAPYSAASKNSQSSQDSDLPPQCLAGSSPDVSEHEASENETE